MEKSYFVERFLTNLIVLILSCCAVMFTLIFNVHAVDQSGETSLPELYTNNIFVAVNNQPCEEYNYVNGMDVSASGSFFVVLHNGTMYYIDIYDSSLSFQRQLVLSSTGSIYASFGQHDDELVVYLPKEQIKLNLKTNGEYMSASTHESVPAVLLDQFINGYERELNSYRYLLETTANNRTALVESKDGKVMYQYSSMVYKSSRHILLITLLIFAIMYVIFKKKISNQ